MTLHMSADIVTPGYVILQCCTCLVLMSGWCGRSALALSWWAGERWIGGYPVGHLGVDVIGWCARVFGEGSCPFVTVPPLFPAREAFRVPDGIMATQSTGPPVNERGVQLKVCYW